MVVKIYISGISGNKEVKKKQQRVQMILDSKSISYETIDITEPGREKEKETMQTNAKPREALGKHPLPPQIFNEDEYCGDYEDFDMANEVDELEAFLHLPIPSKLISPENETEKLNGSREDSVHNVRNGEDAVKETGEPDISNADDYVNDIPADSPPTFQGDRIDEDREASPAELLAENEEPRLNNEGAEEPDRDAEAKDVLRDGYSGVDEPERGMMSVLCNLHSKQPMLVDDFKKLVGDVKSDNECNGELKSEPLEYQENSESSHKLALQKDTVNEHEEVLSLQDSDSTNRVIGLTDIGDHSVTMEKGGVADTLHNSTKATGEDAEDILTVSNGDRDDITPNDVSSDFVKFEDMSTSSVSLVSCGLSDETICDTNMKKMENKAEVVNSTLDEKNRNFERKNVYSALGVSCASESKHAECEDQTHLLNVAKDFELFKEIVITTDRKKNETLERLDLATRSIAVELCEKNQNTETAGNQIKEALIISKFEVEEVKEEAKPLSRRDTMKNIKKPHLPLAVPPLVNEGVKADDKILDSYRKSKTLLIPEDIAYETSESLEDISGNLTTLEENNVEYKISGPTIIENQQQYKSCTIVNNIVSGEKKEAMKPEKNNLSDQFHAEGVPTKELLMNTFTPFSVDQIAFTPQLVSKISSERNKEKEEKGVVLKSWDQPATEVDVVKEVRRLLDARDAELAYSRARVRAGRSPLPDPQRHFRDQINKLIHDMDDGEERVSWPVVPPPPPPPKIPTPPPEPPVNDFILEVLKALNGPYVPKTNLEPVMPTTPSFIKQVKDLLNTGEMPGDSHQLFLTKERGPQEDTDFVNKVREILNEKESSLGIGVSTKAIDHTVFLSDVLVLLNDESLPLDEINAIQPEPNNSQQVEQPDVYEKHSSSVLEEPPLESIETNKEKEKELTINDKATVPKEIQVAQIFAITRGYSDKNSPLQDSLEAEEANEDGQGQDTE